MNWNKFIYINMFNSNALEYYGVNLAPSPTFDLFLPKKKKKNCGMEDQTNLQPLKIEDHVNYDWTKNFKRKVSQKENKNKKKNSVKLIKLHFP